MKKFQEIASYLLASLNGMLLVLWVFEQKVAIPESIQVFGRMHPLVLHLPIGVFLITAVLFFLRSYFLEKNIFSFLFLITALLTSFTALCGIFLGSEPNYNATELFNHKVTGLVSSVLCWIVYELNEKKWNYRSYVIAFTAFLIILTGHLGGILTHGEDFLFPSGLASDRPEFDKTQSVYNAAIFPIFENKCLSCHNDKKKKGQFDMSSLRALLKGGKNGDVWIPGNAFNSHIIKQITSSSDAKGHMPPKGKPQLSYAEITLLEHWINAGADTLIAVSELSDSDTMNYWIRSLYSANLSLGKVYTFNAAKESVLEKVNTPFCTVEPLALGSPALKANFYVQAKFEEKSLENLKQIKNQLVSLNLNKMPVSDDHVTLLASFPNLENLSLNQSEISGQNLDLLKQSKALISLSLSGCQLASGSLAALEKIKSLETLYLWNTGLDQKEIEAFKVRNEEINVIEGFGNDEELLIKLNPPILANKDFVIRDSDAIELKHVLPNVIIRYTSDGSTPDSLESKIYTDKIEVKDFLQISTLATKESWYASDVKTFSFFRSNFQADSVWLLSTPNPKYPGSGAKTIADLKQGDPINFSDKSWIGYKEKDAEIMIKLEAENNAKGITISYLINQASYIMPPRKIEVWAGSKENELKLISVIEPPQLEKPVPRTINAEKIELKGPYQYLKIVAQPLAKLPHWHGAASKKAWVFFDEIYLY